MQRHPIKVIRIPISEPNILISGGWAVFPISGDRPKIKINEDEKLLWCPYCGKWSIFKKVPEDHDMYRCTGKCGWSSTKDYYVKKFNNLWWDGIPLNSIKKLNKKGL